MDPDDVRNHRNGLWAKLRSCPWGTDHLAHRLGFEGLEDGVVTQEREIFGLNIVYRDPVISLGAEDCEAVHLGIYLLRNAVATFLERTGRGSARHRGLGTGFASVDAVVEGENVVGRVCDHWEVRSCHRRGFFCKMMEVVTAGAMSASD